MIEETTLIELKNGDLDLRNFYWVAKIVDKSSLLKGFTVIEIKTEKGKSRTTSTDGCRLHTLILEKNYPEGTFRILVLRKTYILLSKTEAKFPEWSHLFSLGYISMPKIRGNPFLHPDPPLPLYVETHKVAIHTTYKKLISAMRKEETLNFDYFRDLDGSFNAYIPKRATQGILFKHEHLKRSALIMPMLV